MPKRASQSGETCRAAKRARNKDDSSARKISSSKLLRTDKMSRQKCRLNLSACPHPACAVYLGLCSSPMDSVPQLLRTDKKFRRQNAVGYFYVGLPTYARRGLICALQVTDKQVNWFGTEKPRGGSIVEYLRFIRISKSKRQVALY